jgi:hypothetical protein
MRDAAAANVTRTGRRAPLARMLAAGLLTVAGLAVVGLGASGLGASGLAVGGPGVAHAAEASTPAALEEYVARVDRARATVAGTADGDLDQRAARDLAAAVNTLLPATERVEMPDGRVIAVDNAIVRSLVARLDAAPSPALRREVTADLGGHLDSLRVALGTPGAGVAADPAALAELLDLQKARDRSSASRLFADLVDRIVVWLQEWWARAGSSERSSTVLSVVGIVLVALLAVTLLAVLVRAILRARAGLIAPVSAVAPSPDGPVVAAAQGLPPDARAFADELAAQGRHRDGVRALWGGAARLLVEAGIVRQARTRTNHELLREVEPAAPALGIPLASLSALFERAWYGRTDPGADGFAHALRAYDDVTALAASATGATGAGEGA